MDVIKQAFKQKFDSNNQYYQRFWWLIQQRSTAWVTHWIFQLNITSSLKLKKEFSEHEERLTNLPKLFYFTDDCSTTYTCEWNKWQYGHDLIHSPQPSKSQCADQCCNNDKCILFDFDPVSKYCWLSETSRIVAPLSVQDKKWSCQLKFEGMTYSHISEGVGKSKRKNVEVWG